MKNDLIKIKFSVEQKEALKKMQLQIKAAEASYGREFESIKDFLRVHGFIKPRDFDEFIWWLYLIKLKQEQLYPVPKITDTLFIEYHEYRKQNLLSNTNHKTQGEAKKLIIDIKPVFKPEVFNSVFDIIKDFFSIEQQGELKRVIKTGSLSGEKLIFKDNGNRLTDTFKKLFESNFIIGCEKQDLIKWVISNFMFVQQKKAKEYIYDTVEKTISRKGTPCKRPLIDIKNGEIVKHDQQNSKKHR